MPQVPSFEAIDSLRDLDVFVVQIMLGWHRGGSLSAVKDVMVTMTFDGSLRGLPVAAVLENNFFWEQVG